MTTKHTPGPWFHDQPENMVFSYMPNGKRLLVAQARSIDVPVETRDANASLIAEAPNLLEALRNLVIAADNLDPQSGIPIGYEQLIDAVTFADAAIARATGAA